MGFTYPSPSQKSQLYNRLFYPSLGSDGLLTFDYAETLYLSRNDYRLSYLSGIIPGSAVSGTAVVLGASNEIIGLGSVSCSSLMVNGSSISSSPAYVIGITSGLAAANKALVLDSSSNISGINSLSASTLIGTLQTAAQPNITSIGNLSSLTATSITGTLQTASQPNITSIGALSSLTATNITGTLQTAAQSNITSIGTLSGLTIGGNQIFTGASRTITGLSALTATSISGTLQTAAQPNITSIGTLSALTVSGALNGTISTAAQPNITSVGVQSMIDVLQPTNTTVSSFMSSYGLVVHRSSTTVGDNCGICFGITNASISGVSPGATLSFTRTGANGIGSLRLSVKQSTDLVEGIRIDSDLSTTLAGSLTIAGVVNASSGITSSGMITGSSLSVSGSATIATCTISSTLSVSNTSSLSNTNVSGILTVSGGSNLNTLAVSSTSVLTGTCNVNGNLVVDPAKTISGFIATPNQSLITSVGILQELSVGSTATSDSFLLIAGNGSQYIDSSYTRVCRFHGSNVTAVKLVIEVDNGSSGTSTNAAFIGTESSNDLRFGTGNSTRAIITAAGRMGIGTVSPTAGLQVSINVSTTIDPAGSGASYFTRTSGFVNGAVGPISSIPVAISAVGAITASSGFYATSDARKKNFHAFDTSTIMASMLKVQPRLYRYKSQPSNVPLQVGYSAQDLLKNGLGGVVSFINNEALTVEDPSVDIPGVEFNVDYSRMIVYAHVVIIELSKQVASLQATSVSLSDRVAKIEKKLLMNILPM